MKAVIIHAPGAPEQLVIADVPEPMPGPGEVLVDVAFAGCNWADTQERTGVYPHPRSYPLVPGIEISGTVSKLGPDVSGVRVGDRVAAFLEQGGAYAEKAVVRANMLMPLPPEIPFDVGAALTVQPLTGYHMLHTIHGVEPEETVLINAIGGGVGLFTTQLAVTRGTRYSPESITWGTLRCCLNTARFLRMKAVLSPIRCCSGLPLVFRHAGGNNLTGQPRFPAAVIVRVSSRSALPRPGPEGPTIGTEAHLLEATATDGELPSRLVVPPLEIGVGADHLVAAMPPIANYCPPAVASNSALPNLSGPIPGGPRYYQLFVRPDVRPCRDTIYPLRQTRRGSPPSEISRLHQIGFVGP